MTAERDHGDGLTPQERLAVSREALIAQLYGAEYSEESRSHPFDTFDAIEEPRPRRADGTGPRAYSWSAVASNVVRRWWRRHPANAAGQLALPVLERYARDGRAAALMRPWTEEIATQQAWEAALGLDAQRGAAAGV